MFRNKLQNLHHKINTFLSINGSSSSDLKSLLQSHAFVITTGHTHNVYIAAKLISLYASNKNLISSRKVFDFITFKDPFLWNSIIKAYFSNGKYTESLEFYSSMRGFNALPNQFTIPMVVSACAELVLVEIGREIHGLVLKLNLFDNNCAAGASLVYMYSKCGVMEYASDVFDEIPVRDVVSWTAIIKGYVENGESSKGLEYFCLMCKNGEGEVRPNFRTLEGGFQACGNLGALVEGKCFHGLAMKSGFGCYQVVQSSVLSMYSKCGSVEETCRSFCEVDEKDLFSWTRIIAVYAKYECIGECVDMFLKMQASGISLDGMVISCVLSGLGNAMMISEAKTFHGFILRRNYNEDHMVGNALLAMYCKLKLLSLAEKIFNGVNGQNTEAWNVMAIGYWKAGLEAKCINLFREMQYLGIEYDINSLISVISSCSWLEKFHLGKSLHCHIIKNLMIGNVSVANSLIDMYGRSMNLTLSWRVFCMMTDKDVVTWNTMMTSYSSCGKIVEAFGLFDEMRAESYKPNIATLVILLSASSQVSSLEKGEKVHQYIKEVGFGKNTLLDTALTDMYAKCGQLTKSREIFDSMEKKDIVSWNVLISGYAMYGEANYAIEMFKKMEQTEIKPNELTFLAVLSACTHAGLVEEGKFIFSRMKDYSLMPTLKHYSCMVDLLGRSGNLDDAETLVLSMPIAPDAAIWGSLLSSCKLHSQVEKGIRIAKHAIESDPENDGYYIAISDLYSSVGMWEEVEIVRKIMKNRKVRKEVGWSTV
ncbi:pentatricopeptide repeat-containing protein At4g39952, mitochondrial [Solanum dulcamara]|uniref:pentatricopeptide repeat-containing protein At4g39952, mitochondrial n=1 Tax=Solanum dulcamara TaxID=45834 RepID=UPI0024859EA1|nr:pentatricopeptide repeat-containing protein At4g39952, mitochondrial [Solanum dulcamara]